MNKYLLTGTYRKSGSIGNSEKFSEISTGETAKEAMNTIREGFYADGYEHILFKTCRENGKSITMLKALGLE